MKNLSHEDIEQINNMKNYLDSLPPVINDKKAYCFMITKSEINELLTQKNDGQSLDGIRVYLGANVIEGHVIPNIHVIACEKDAENSYNDFEPETNNLKKQDLPLVAQGKPCPTECGKKRFIYI